MSAPGVDLRPRPAVVTLLVVKSVIFVAMCAVVGACAGTDLHEVTTCGPGAPVVLPGVTKCEMACSGAYKLGAQGSGCDAHNPDLPGMQSCSYSVTIDGVTGCCSDVGAGSDTVNRFLECD